MARVGRLVKESVLKELETQLSHRPSFFITAIGRLSAPEADALRQKLFSAQADLVIVQRKLGLRAVAPLKIEGLDALFDGSIGLVLPSADALPIAKTIIEFTKTHEEQLVVRGAVIEGQLLDRRRVEQLAGLPPKPVLLAQVVATLESPITDAIFTIERLIGDLAWLAEQIAAKKPQSSDGGEIGGAAPSAVPPTPSAPGAGVEQQPSQQDGSGTPEKA